LLVGIGLALVAFGALILLRFPDRPGGRLRLAGMEVSSVGAGLPLVALGVAARCRRGAAPAFHLNQYRRTCRRHRWRKWRTASGTWLCSRMYGGVSGGRPRGRQRAAAATE